MSATPNLPERLFFHKDTDTFRDGDKRLAYVTGPYDLSLAIEDRYNAHAALVAERDALRGAAQAFVDSIESAIEAPGMPDAAETERRWHLYVALHTALKGAPHVS